MSLGQRHAQLPPGYVAERAHDMVVASLEEGRRPIDAELPEAIEKQACCPLQLCAREDTCFPDSMRVIQDWTHLFMIIGILAGIAISAYDLPVIATHHCHASCITEVVDLLFIFPCTVQLLVLMQHYDNRRQTRLRALALALKKEKMIFEQTLQEMNGILLKSSENNFELAERQFTSHRRDFGRFLSEFWDKFGRDFRGTPQEAAFTKALCQTIHIWLHVYEEASVDPQGHPLTLEAYPGEFFSTTGAQQMIQLVRDRLDQTPLQLISRQITTDSQAIARWKAVLAESVFSMPVQGTPSGGQALLARGRILSETPSSSSSGSTSWLLCFRRRLGFRCIGPSEESVAEWACGCCRLTVLGNDHLRLLIALPAAIVLLACWLVVPLSQGNQAFELITSSLGWVPVTLFLLCLLAVLAKMEAISQVQILTAQAASFRRQAEDVQARNKEMQEFYGAAQMIVDVWLERTLPRMDLIKELELKLLDTSSDLLLTQLANVNEKMEEIEESVGGVGSWMRAVEDGGDEARMHQQHFGRRVSKLLRARTQQRLEDHQSVPANSIDRLVGGLQQEFNQELGKRHSLTGRQSHRVPALDQGVCHVESTLAASTAVPHEALSGGPANASAPPNLPQLAAFLGSA